MKMRKQMCKWFGNEDGATSVLIIFMMIVLVTLGVFAITSADVNVKFSRKAAGWSEKYYALESLGERYVSEIDYALAKAEADAIAFTEQQDFRGLQGEMSLEMQAWVMDQWAVAPMEVTPDLVFDVKYMELARAAVGAVNAAYAESEALETENGIASSVVFVDANDDAYRLRVTLAIETPEHRFSVSDTNTVLMEKAEDAARYAVTEWRQAQKEKDYETQEIWNGAVQ